MEKGTFESTKWVDEIIYKTDQSAIVQRLYDFKMYRRVVKTCSDEIVYEMQNLIAQRGLTAGVKAAIIHCRQWRIDQGWQKERHIYNLEQSQNVKMQSLKEQLDEEDRLSMLDDQQRRLRDATWPGKGNVPRSVSLSQPVIYSYEDENGVGYRIYEKIYWYYSAVIYSPRLKDAGEEIFLQHHDWKEQWGLQYKVDLAYKGEKERNDKYIGTKGYDTIRKNVVPKKQNNSGYTPNIDKVRRNLGLDGNDDQNLNGDIF